MTTTMQPPTRSPAAPRPFASLPEEVFLCCVDETSGALRVNRVLCGLLLGAAALGELLLAGAITIRGGRITNVDSDASVAPEAIELRDYVCQDRSLTRVRDWVSVLGPDSYHSTGRRLVASGHAALRRRFGRSPVYLATCPNGWMTPRVRLAALLGEALPLTGHDRLLCGLIHAAALTTQVLPDQPVAQRRLTCVARDLPGPAHDLIAHATAATARTVLAHTH